MRRAWLRRLSTPGIAILDNERRASNPLVLLVCTEYRQGLRSITLSLHMSDRVCGGLDCQPDRDRDVDPMPDLSNRTQSCILQNHLQRCLHVKTRRETRRLSWSSALLTHGRLGVVTSLVPAGGVSAFTDAKHHGRTIHTLKKEADSWKPHACHDNYDGAPFALHHDRESNAVMQSHELPQYRYLRTDAVAKL